MATLRVLLGVTVLAICCWTAFFARSWERDLPGRSGALLTVPAPAPDVSDPAPTAVVTAPVPVEFPPTADARPTPVVPPGPALPVAVGAATTRIVGAEAVNLRTGPDSAAAVIRPYPAGTPVTVMEETGGWVRVTVPDGTDGWIYGRFVAEAPRA